MAIQTKCLECKKEISFTKSQFDRSKKHFCSFNCRFEYGHKRRMGEYRICVKCGKKFFGKSGEIKRGAVKYCSKKCLGTLKKERKMSTDGYWVIHTPYGEMKEQRWLMYRHIRRKLLPSEIVHHINFNKLDNRIENLMIVTRSEHNLLHKVGNHYRRDFARR